MSWRTCSTSSPLATMVTPPHWRAARGGISPAHKGPLPVRPLHRQLLQCLPTPHHRPVQPRLVRHHQGQVAVDFDLTCLCLMIGKDDGGAPLGRAYHRLPSRFLSISVYLIFSQHTIAKVKPIFYKKKNEDPETERRILKLSMMLSLFLFLFVLLFLEAFHQQGVR